MTLRILKLEFIVCFWEYFRTKRIFLREWENARRKERDVIRIDLSFVGQERKTGCIDAELGFVVIVCDNVRFVKGAHDICNLEVVGFTPRDNLATDTEREHSAFPVDVSFFQF